MVVISILLILLVLALFIYLYNVKLLFYREKIHEFTPHEEDCFHPDAKSIIKKHEDSDKAVLFIHGFSASPCMYKWSSEYLYEKGYDCYAPLLPAHGTDWHEFVDSNVSTWFHYIDKYYVALRKQYKTLHVVGISMGGAMTLRLAELYSGTDLEMNSIGSIAAPVVYNSYFRDHIVIAKSGYWGRTLSKFRPCINPANRSHREGHNDGDENMVDYAGVYTKQGVSLAYFLIPVRRDLKKITVPLFACHCTSDRTVPFGNLGIIERETSSKCKKIEKLEMGSEFIHSHHVLLHYNSSRETVMNWLYPFMEEHNER